MIGITISAALIFYCIGYLIGKSKTIADIAKKKDSTAYRVYLRIIRENEKDI